RNPVGTGPFKFMGGAQGAHITLKKNDSYFLSGKPYLDGIEFRFLLVDQSRIDALQSGDLTWADAAPLQQLNPRKSDPLYNYATSATAGIPDYIAMNTKQPPFDDKLVRQAVYWALDRDAIRQVAYFGAGESGIEEVPTGSSWYDGSPIGAPDVEKGKSLVGQGGVTSALGARGVRHRGGAERLELVRRFAHRGAGRREGEVAVAAGGRHDPSRRRV